MEPNKFDIRGFKVYITRNNLDELRKIDNIESSSILKDECPVVAEGKWSQSGNWIFFRTYSEDHKYNYEFDEFITQYKEGKNYF